MKTIFKNNSDNYNLWWNRSNKAISVAIFNKDGIFVSSSKIYPGSYVIIPANAILRSFLVSDN